MSGLSNKGTHLNTPLFSVIIPTCNRRDLLSLCLNGFAPGVQVGFDLVPPQSQLTSSNAAYDVIVTDDGSATDFKQWLKDEYPWAHYKSGPQRGPAANRNNGAKSAQGKWLLFIDDDCIPEPNLLSAYSDTLNDHACNAVEGAIHPAEPEQGDLVECPVNTTGGYFWSANVCIEKTIFDNIQGFDENYPYPAMEDCDIFLRLKQVTKIPFAKDAIVVHPLRKLTLKQAFTKANRHIPSFAYYTQKHGQPLNLTSISSVVLEHIQFHLRNSIKYMLATQWGWCIYHSYLLSVGSVKLAIAYRRVRIADGQ